jgi:hypothetical protein
MSKRKNPESSSSSPKSGDSQPVSKVSKHSIEDESGVPASVPKISPGTQPDEIKVPPSGEKAEWAGFGAIEHQAIGNEAFRKFVQESCASLTEDDQEYEFFQEASLSSNYRFSLDEVKLTAGEISCLAGDFYGPDSPETVISSTEDEKERQRRFELAFISLKEAKRDRVDSYLDIIEDKLPEIMKSVHEKQLPSLGSKTYSFLENVRFILASVHFPQSWFVLPSLYVRLALYNFDHFGGDAETAYRTGHKLACETALKALKNNKIDLYVLALAMELFASHYLSDLFASGHIRTPRRKIYDQIARDNYISGRTPFIAGLLAKEMHDEDGNQGLTVENSKLGVEPWKAKGDDCYYDPENANNHKLVVEAVNVGLNEVYSYARENQKEIKFAALQYIPRPAAENFPALFKTDQKGDILVRERVNDTKCTDYRPLETNQLQPLIDPSKVSWTPEGIALRRLAFFRSGGQKETLTNEEAEKLKKELELEWGHIPDPMPCKIF